MSNKIQLFAPNHLKIAKHIQPVYLKNVQCLDSLHTSCFGYGIIGSNNKLQKLISGYFEEISSLQLYYLAQAVEYFNYKTFEEYKQASAKHEFSIFPFLSIFEDITQQFLVFKYFRGLDNSTYYNNTYKAIRKKYKVYGRMFFNKDLGEFEFSLRELDPYQVDKLGYQIDKPSYNYRFKSEPELRASCLRHLRKTLKKAGIKYLNLSQWISKSNTRNTSDSTYYNTFLYHDFKELESSDFAAFRYFLQPKA